MFEIPYKLLIKGKAQKEKVTRITKRLDADESINSVYNPDLIDESEFCFKINYFQLLKDVVSSFPPII